MMMRVLEQGGVPILADGIRVANEDNPKGYYEFERVKKELDESHELLKVEDDEERQPEKHGRGMENRLFPDDGGEAVDEGDQRAARQPAAQAERGRPGQLQGDAGPVRVYLLGDALKAVAARAGLAAGR